MPDLKIHLPVSVLGVQVMSIATLHIECVHVRSFSILDAGLCICGNGSMTMNNGPLQVIKAFVQCQQSSRRGSNSSYAEISTR